MKYSKEKYIYSHELMYLSVIKQKQTVFFVTSCVSHNIMILVSLHNINKNKLRLLHLLYFNQQTLTLLYVSRVFKMVSWLTLATPSRNT